MGEYFGNYYKCNFPNSSRLYRRFAELRGKYGLLYKMNEIIAAYKQGRTCEQLKLF